MDWIGLPDEQQLKNWHSFVYLITRTNALPGEKRYYVGVKKLTRVTRRPPLKGTKRVRKITKESDYKTYYGSSKMLEADLAKHGPENFRREILHLCESQWVAKYLEAYEQVKRRVLFDEESYNSMFNLRIGKCPIQYRDRLISVMGKC